MNEYHSMDCNRHGADHGPSPYVVDMAEEARKNQNFRTVAWTGCHLQMTFMNIPACGEIGLEMHPETDQLIRVEQGQAVVRMGNCRDTLDMQCTLRDDEAVLVPAGTWHNVRNTGYCPLKLSSLYAPPQHPRGTIHCTKEDAANAKR